MPNTLIEKALADLQQGKMIVLIDDHDRENEADLVIAAEHISEDTMRFIMQHGCGIVCLSMFATHAEQLGLKLLAPKEQNNNQYQTPFAMSFEARTGVTTGISVHDRLTTIRAATKTDATQNDIVTPGHMFPLIAQDHGVLTRRGHTEGSVDLVKIAGLKPQAVICELMNSDGSVAKGAQVKHFAEQHNLTVVSIQDIVNFRLQQEDFIEEHTTTTLPLEKYGNFKLSVIKEKLHHTEHVILEKDILDPNQPCLVRIHSSCLTGDIFHSLRCDCYEQLHYSLDVISKEGGIEL
jgi:3,4-dihydroxy 2-butanone 4-phosphate synthase/GTP cyclohydrolase II